jgi:hypothetical protein
MNTKENLKMEISQALYLIKMDIILKDKCSIINIKKEKLKLHIQIENNLKDLFMILKVKLREMVIL